MAEAILAVAYVLVDFCEAKEERLELGVILRLVHIITLAAQLFDLAFESVAFAALLYGEAALEIVFHKNLLSGEFAIGLCFVGYDASGSGAFVPFGA